MRTYCFLGIDVGNTKLAFGLVEGDARAFHEKRVIATEPHLGAEQALEKIIVQTCNMLEMAPKPVAGIGIAFGGFVDVTRTVGLASPNFPGLENVPMVEMIRELAPGVPVSMDNDANVAGVGEAMYGKARGHREAVYLTISTGIGGAVLFDGKPLAGSQGLAAEFGHMIVQPNGRQCTCGSRGCLEAIASGTSIARMARERVRGRDSLINNLAGTPDDITAGTVCKAAQAGDELAKAIVQEVAFYLGIGLANIISGLDPDIVVLGGGVMNSADILLPPAIQLVERHLTVRGAKVPPIEASDIHDDVALWGAMALARAAAGKR
ncbi:MAG: ROK family protein [Firmicutes bacterium]|nr:ROK family protein [Bacillota bacterium]